MDAKTNIVKMGANVIDFNKTLMVALLRTDAKFPEIVRNRTDAEISQMCNEYADLIETLARDAALGRAAEKNFKAWVISAECPCKGIYKQESCVLLWDEQCENVDYCRIRAGKEAGE